MLKFAGILSMLGSQAFSMEYNAKEKLLNLPLSRIHGFSPSDIREALFPSRNSGVGASIISLTSEDDHVYGVNISIGTPPQYGYLLVLNESPDIFVYSQNCTTQDEDWIFYDPNNSTSYVAGSNQTLELYGLNATNQQGQETICLNSESSDNTTS